MITTQEHPLTASPYQGYSYAYPHKTAYRPLPQPVSLKEAWSRENRDRLFLYVHVPFCEMRCAFCNLFTQAVPKDSLVTQYLTTLIREIQQTRDFLGEAQFARFAIGGGTPTFLSTQELATLFDQVESTLNINCREIPISVETSPATVSDEKLAMLYERGVTRISIGIQSFYESETKDVARPQPPEQLHRTLRLLTESGIATVNHDLIYGLPGQTVETWLSSLKESLRYHPEELYLYPLYVRELTTLGRQDREWDDDRITMYREGRDLLLSHGYQQISMRMFRAAHAPDENGPVYCCQSDGMVGLGCGARSYLQDLHYSNDYAVKASGVREILAHYVERSTESFAHADYGIHLNEDEQRRRFLIQSLLQKEGLSFVDYQSRFMTEALTDFPELSDLIEHNLAHLHEQRLTLNADGLERSDAVGPWLYSPTVQNLMNAWELR